MVKRGPRTNGKAGCPEGREDGLGEAGLQVDDVAHGVKPWPLHGISGAQIIVEDAGDDLDEGAAKPRAARGADSER